MRREEGNGDRGGKERKMKRFREERGECFYQVLEGKIGTLLLNETLHDTTTTQNILKLII